MEHNHQPAHAHMWENQLRVPECAGSHYGHRVDWCACGALRITLVFQGADHSHKIKEPTRIDAPSQPESDAKVKLKWPMLRTETEGEHSLLVCTMILAFVLLILMLAK